MLQRIQSVYLLAAALIALSTWLAPMATLGSAEGPYALHTTGLFAPDGSAVADAQVRMPFHVVLSVLAAVLLAAIFLFRDRHRQRRVVRGCYLVVLLVIAFQVITLRSVQAWLEAGGPVVTRPGWSMVAPALVLVLAFLADRAIRRDEELVRSADRLR